MRVKYVSGMYDVSSIKGMMICASYINWKRGIFGDNITLANGSVNPNVRQLIILTKINMSDVLIKNPAVLKQIGNFRRHRDAINRSYITNDRWNLFMMVGNLAMVLLVGFTIMIQYDLTNIKKASKRRRRDSDPILPPPVDE